MGDNMAKITHDHTITRDADGPLCSTLRAVSLPSLSEVSGWLLMAVHGTTPSRGLVMLVVAGLLWRSKRAALWLYAALLLATMIWGVWKSGSTGRSRRVAISVFSALWLCAVCLASAGGSFQRRGGGFGRNAD